MPTERISWVSPTRGHIQEDHKNLTWAFKGSVQRDEWGVGHMLVQFLLVWDSRDRD